MLARCAPVRPAVCVASSSKSTSSASTYREASRCSSALRPLMSGGGTDRIRSNRPGRTRALSRTRAWLVAAITTRPWFCAKPSISTSSALSVCACSARLSSYREAPTESISSMKMIAGASFRAAAKSARTRLAPTPTYFSSKLEAEAERKGTPASPATARARSVLPVPGGPSSSTPRGICAPSRAKACGSRRKATASRSSAFTSSTPCTSSKRVEQLATREPNSRVWLARRSEPSSAPAERSARIESHAARVVPTERMSSRASFSTKLPEA
mmetsp:Transcript_46831/g.107558  ORF Transcript_46831/g.107558 Transcript_46831/m.107558 type:complete len:271 (-) Transcript_46831:54-866(-)